MNPAIYFLCFLPLILVLLQQWYQRKQWLQHLIYRRKNAKGRSNMLEIAKRFLGKECIVYMLQSQIVGTIHEVTQGAVLLRHEESLEALNPEYIMRIREYPRNKKGKKKSVVLD